MTAVCKVCEAAHAMCLSGDGGAQAADFLKAAIVQERKAKEAAEAEAATLRAEVERLNGIIDAERDMQAKLVAEGTRLSAELTAARAALRTEREACDLLAFAMDKATETRLEVAADHRARRAAEAKGAT